MVLMMSCCPRFCVICSYGASLVCQTLAPGGAWCLWRCQEESGGARDRAADDFASLMQAGRRFCSMLVGANASCDSVPAEHVIVLARALRDHLLACSLPGPEPSEPPKQRKKRKQKSAPAVELAQVGGRSF